MFKFKRYGEYFLDCLPLQRPHYVSLLVTDSVTKDQYYYAFPAFFVCCFFENLIINFENITGLH